LSGIDQSWEWPPLFGPISEAYSMRGFWGKFWHRLVYKPFMFHPSVISRALHIPQGTTFSRIFNNYLVFVLSAVMHAAVTWRYGGKCAWGRGMIFWCIQPVSFVLEVVVQFYWIKFRKNWLSWMTPAVISFIERAVGYVWVMAWLMWSVLKMTFVSQNCPA
jgi:hypothetical protein